MWKDLVRFLLKFVSSLGFKLSFYAGLLMFLVLLAFTYHSIKGQEENLTDKMIQGALKDSEVIKAALWHGMMTNDKQVVREVVKAVGTQAGVEEVNIYDAKVIIRFSSNDSLEEKAAASPSDALFRDLATNTAIRHRFSRDGMSVRVVNPILSAETCSAAACHAHPEAGKVLGALAIKVPLGEAKQAIYERTRETVIFAFLLFILVSTVIGLTVILYLNPRIRRLERKAVLMARGEYKPRELSTRADEFADLSRSFEEMSRLINERTTILAEGRKLYKSLFEEVSCYLTVVNRDYRIVRANKAFEEHFGDQVGKHCFQSYKKLPERCAKCPVEKTFADGFSHQSEETWKLEDSDAHVLVKTAPIFDDQGDLVEVLEMSLDITVLKQLQIELEKRTEEYRNLFANVPCYITVVNRDFDIIQANRLFEEDFGQRIGEKCFRAYKQRESRCDNCPVEKTFDDGRSHQSEEVWRRDGQETNIVVQTSPLVDDNRTITAVMEMSTNITEVKRLQSELALLGETVAGMSHTIKNILSGLQGGVYMVDSGFERNKQERVAEGWGMVKRNVEKVSQLVQGVLYASKARAPEYKECDPGQLLSEVCDLFEVKCRSEGIVLAREFEENMGLGLLDPSGIHSALSNLLANAVEACRATSKEQRRIKVSGRVLGGTLIMKVADTGIGIPEEVREKLFGKFYSTKGSRGTGLGLVLTKKVVEEHGGSIDIDAESEPGKGTTFRIEIPFRPISRTQALRNAL